MAKKVILVCDQFGKEVDENRGGQLRYTPADARRPPKQADLCDECGGNLPGQTAKRRGRRPAGVAA